MKKINIIGRGFAPLLLLCAICSSIFAGFEIFEEGYIGHEACILEDKIVTLNVVATDYSNEWMIYDFNAEVILVDSSSSEYIPCLLQEVSDDNFVCIGYLMTDSIFHDYDIVVYNYSSSMVEQWHTAISNDNSNEIPYSINITWDNGFILGGKANRHDGNKNQYLCKLDSLGNIEWIREHDMGGFDIIADIIPTPDCCYLSSGYKNAGTDSIKTILVKYDSEGYPIWMYPIESVGGHCKYLYYFESFGYLLFNYESPLLRVEMIGDSIALDTLELPFQVEDIGYYDTDKFIATGHLFSDSLETDVYPTNTSLFLVQYPDSIIWQRRIEDYDVSGGLHKNIFVDRDRNRMLINGQGTNFLMLADTLGNVTPPVHIEPGWNLLSYPYMDSLNFLEKYPFADLHSYYYYTPAGSYFDYNVVKADNGFWLFSFTDTTIDLKTTVRPPSIPPTLMRPTVSIPWRTQTLYPGWNIIATPTIPTDCANLCETYPEIIPPIYKYVPSEAAYAIADSLFASYGYWVLCEDTVEVSLPK